jgi:MerC mercury resistance protein
MGKKNNMKGFFRRYLDAAGFSASLLCAIHCAFVPVLVTLSFFEGLYFLADPTIERVVLAMSFFLALASLLPSYLKHHHRLSPILIFVLGAFLIILGRLDLSSLWEILFTSVGATCIAVAHLVNWKLHKNLVRE